MNYAHIHLILTHVPVIGIGGVMLLLIIATVRRSNELMNVALTFAILLSLVTIPVYLTGESQPRRLLKIYRVSLRN